MVTDLAAPDDWPATFDDRREIFSRGLRKCETTWKLLPVQKKYETC
jgi:hypothetical protein